jgi:cell division cycle 14
MADENIFPVLGNLVFLGVSNEVSETTDGEYYCFKPQNLLQYHPFCDDFGPMNLACAVKFIDMLDEAMSEFASHKILVCVNEGRRNMTNTCFLLGSYMILKLNLAPEVVASNFAWLESWMMEPFRDATYADADFFLTLEDCWRGLWRAKQLRWIDVPDDQGICGQYDINEYSHYDDPLNGDLHEVVPGLFVAMKGPKELGGLEFRDDERGYRQFGAAYYADLLHEFNVSDVIRLNEPEYDSEDFESHGIRHHHLEFEDCTAPTARIADAFLRIAESAAGAVAVHCTRVTRPVTRPAPSPSRRAWAAPARSLRSI